MQAGPVAPDAAPEMTYRDEQTVRPTAQTAPIAKFVHLGDPDRPAATAHRLANLGRLTYESIVYSIVVCSCKQLELFVAVADYTYRLG